jgi:hypothetical protein
LLWGYSSNHTGYIEQHCRIDGGMNDDRHGFDGEKAVLTLTDCAVLFQTQTVIKYRRLFFVIPFVCENKFYCGTRQGIEKIVAMYRIKYVSLDSYYFSIS